MGKVGTTSLAENGTTHANRFSIPVFLSTFYEFGRFLYLAFRDLFEKEMLLNSNGAVIRK